MSQSQQTKSKRVMKKVYRRKKAVRAKYDVPEKASLTELCSWGSVCQTNTNYKLSNVSLATSQRARSVAQGYQFYRITGITVKFKPLMDTFVQGTGTGQTQATVPYLYVMIDRTGRIGNDGFSPRILRELGAKPRRLDDKTLSFTFRPNVLTQTYDNTPGSATNTQYKISPWLPCRDDTNLGVWNPSTIDHLGMVFVADQNLGNNVGYSVEYSIQYEFKKPNVAVYNTDELPPVYGPDDIVPEPEKPVIVETV